MSTIPQKIPFREGKWYDLMEAITTDPRRESLAIPFATEVYDFAARKARRLLDVETHVGTDSTNHYYLGKYTHFVVLSQGH